ncbi:LysR family transcriptional regulator [Halomonas elongata]|uniref:LysR family transcriptional regulator n=1 Tax=Halomonas elongata TaxID=2746 RepID=UPI0023AEC9EE|nr:LysR family transcriptional regulator [Halomonas elongata]
MTRHHGVTLDEIAAFIEVARRGSLQAAAERLLIGSGSVGRCLDALEQRLGTRLLNRSTRALTLTEDGEDYLARVEPALGSITQAGDRLRDRQEGPQGELRVSLPVNYGRLHIAPHLADFLRLHPSVSVDACFDDHFVDIIGEGFDLAIRIGQLGDSRLVAKRIARDRRLIVASPDYLAHHGEPRHPCDLREHHCLHFTRFQGPAQWAMQRDDERHVIPVSGRLKSNYGLPLTLAAEQGLGLVQTSESIVAEALANGRLCEVLSDWKLPDIAVHAVMPARQHTPLKVSACIDFLAKRLPLSD